MVSYIKLTRSMLDSTSKFFILFSLLLLHGCTLKTEHASKEGFEQRIKLLEKTPEQDIVPNFTKAMELEGLENTYYQNEVEKLLEATNSGQLPKLENVDCRPDKSKEIELLWKHHYKLPPRENNKWGEVAFALFSLATLQVPAVVVTVYDAFTNKGEPPPQDCRIWLELKDGVVASYRYEGAGCDRFPIEKEAMQLMVKSLPMTEKLVYCW